MVYYSRNKRLMMEVEWYIKYERKMYKNRGNMIEACIDTIFGKSEFE